MSQPRGRRALLPPGTVAGLLLGSVVWAACSGNGALERKLEKAILEAAETGQVFRLEDVTDFDWDELRVFTSYATAEDYPTDMPSTGFRLGSTEEFNTLVFMKDGKSVKALHFPLSKGAFPLSPFGSIRRTSAKFYVVASAPGAISLISEMDAPRPPARRDGGSP